MLMVDSNIRRISDIGGELRRITAGQSSPRLTMVLPLPPSVNHLYANTPNGRIKTKEGKLYKMAVCEELQVQRARQRTPDPPYEVWLWFMLPDRRVRDVSNMVKAIEDNVAEYLGYNDSLNHAMHLYKALDRDNPRAVMVLAHKDRAVPYPGEIE
jgi:crossover junction endodeoxyribonuclease RusA